MDDTELLGGGQLEFVIQGGEVFLNARELSMIFTNSGAHVGADSILKRDAGGLVLAQGVLGLAAKIDEVRSELLRREAEKSLDI